MKKLFLLCFLAVSSWQMAMGQILSTGDTQVINTKHIDKSVISTFKIPYTAYKDTSTVTLFSFDSVWITIKPFKPVNPGPVNKLPVVNAGADRTIVLPAGTATTTTGLSGSASDSDGSIVSYKWTRMNGTGTPAPDNAANTTVSGLATGVSNFRLAVTDNSGGVSFDDVQITVNASPAGGQTFPLSFTPLTTDFSRPNSGAEIWYNAFQVAIPNVQPLDRYWRFVWSAFQSTSATAYSWTIFDQEINKSIDAGQKFSFGIMTQYSGGAGSQGIATYGGGASAYPLYLHNLMAAESTKDVLNDGDWVPNYNSTSYLTYFENLCKAIYQHLKTTVYKGVTYINAINSIDIRGYGNFGEWHNWPYGTSVPSTPSVATLKRIVDAHKNGFPDIRLSAMVGAMGDSWSASPAEVSYYLLTQTNAAGQFGIRRDSWGATEAWYNQDIWENNPRVYNGVQLKTLMMGKWQYAPITGEPCCNSGYAALPSQVTKYHVLSFGNGNYGSVTDANVVLANRNVGYKITLTGGSVTTYKNGFDISLNWNNTGIVPVYEKWLVTYQLVNAAGAVAWSDTSKFTVTMFKPGGQTVTDNCSNVPSGTYTLQVKIIDPNGYRKGFPLANSGGNNFVYPAKTGLVIP